MRLNIYLLFCSLLFLKNLLNKETESVFEYQPHIKDVIVQSIRLSQSLWVQYPACWIFWTETYLEKSGLYWICGGVLHPLVCHPFPWVQVSEPDLLTEYFFFFPLCSAFSIPWFQLDVPACSLCSALACLEVLFPPPSPHTGFSQLQSRLRISHLFPM